MELEDLEKRVVWLDNERQKTNKEIASLRDQIAQLETTIDRQNETIASLEKEVKAQSMVASHVTEVEGIIEQIKADLLKQITALEKKQGGLLKNLEKQEKDDVNTLNKRLSELQSLLPIVSEVRKGMQNRIDEESRLSQRLDMLEKYFENLNTTINTTTQENKRVSDDNQLNGKRLSDLQIEISALRKRIDEERHRNELNIEALQKLETNLKNLLAQETERKQAQIAFIEKSSLTQVERDNIWKTWQERINEISALGTDFTQKLAALEATHKAIQQSQASLDDVNLRFDRRINELTEMHRLNEERFRQEWLSFKGEDQKRWTNYQLTQEEQQQDGTRQIDKLLERISILEDELQAANESLTLINEETEKQLRSLYAVFHDLMESFEQTFKPK